MFGELLAQSCLAHGVAGLVIDAGVRDTTELTALGFPVWSKAVSAQGTSKTMAGSVNVPVVCAGASISPGDVIVGNADGVVVVPRESARAMVEAASQRLAKEDRTRARLKSGELGLDIYGLRNVLAERGVVWRD
jgi:4-hydroxy-4-methyl-2-oxoglutarate aldolase